MAKVSNLLDVSLPVFQVSFNFVRWCGTEMSGVTVGVIIDRKYSDVIGTASSEMVLAVVFPDAGGTGSLLELADGEFVLTCAVCSIFLVELLGGPGWSSFALLVTVVRKGIFGRNVAVGI